MKKLAFAILLVCLNHLTAQVTPTGGSYLTKAKNLSDVPSSATARTNLGAAPTVSPAFTGVPTVPTAAANTNTTQAASTAFVVGQGYTTNPMTTLGDWLFGGASGVPTRLTGNILATPAFPVQIGTSSISAAPVLRTQAEVKTFLAVPNQLKKFTAALAKVRTGTGRCRVMFMGDSGTASFGAAGTGYTGAKANSLPTQFAAALNAQGTPTMEASWMGVNQTIVSPATYDPRLSLGSGWAASGFSSLGLNSLACSTGSAILGFTPTQVIDSVDIYYSAISGNGSFTVNVDGGSTLATINTSSGSGSTVKATVTFSAGIHTINIVASSSTFISVQGEIAYLSTSPSVDIINAGYDAAVAADISNTGTYYRSLSVAEAIAPNLVILQSLINDAKNGTSSGTYTTNITSIITGMQGVSTDVVLVIPYQASSNATYNTNLPIFTAILYTLGATYNTPVFDLGNRWGSWSAANTNGLMYDTLHPSNSGYNDQAGGFASYLSSAIGPKPTAATLGTVGVLFTQTSSTGPNATTSETALTGTGIGSLTIPINTIIAGATYEYMATGYIATLLTPTLQVKAKLGSTVINDTGADALVAITGNGLVQISGSFTCRTSGASGTVIGQASVIYYSSVSTINGIDAVSTNTTAIDTTAGQTFSLTAQFSAATGDSLTITNLALKRSN